MIRTCASCGQKNRVSAEHLLDAVRCGECKVEMGPIAEPIDADAEVFDSVLKRATSPVLVDFWAEWCGPCRRVAPEVKHVAKAMAGRAVVLKVDTEQHPELAARYAVSSIPNFVVLSKGRIVSQQAGSVGHAQMQQWLEEAGA